jgi:putative sigma-54 modulation protein
MGCLDGGKNMQISVTFRHMNTSEALKEHAAHKASRLSRYFDKQSEVHIMMGLERYKHKAEINILSPGMAIYGTEASSDMYNSIDQAMKKIERQIKRNHDKLVTLRPKDLAKRTMRFLSRNKIDQCDESPSTPPAIIEMHESFARPMMIDEAVMQMDLIHNDILVFFNPTTDQINVLYRKKGKQYGLIKTTANSM